MEDREKAKSANGRRPGKQRDAEDKPSTANGGKLTHVDKSATDAVKSAYLDKKK